MSLRRILAVCSLLPLLSVGARALQIQLAETQELEPTNSLGADGHGTAIALEGDTLLVGAPASVLTGSGSVYAYLRQGGSFVFQQKFSFPIGGPGSGFGRRLALDGDTAVIANYHAATAYVRNAGVWTLQQLITPSGAPEYFGTSVALDGDTALIGQSAQTQNEVWAWRRVGTHWSLQQKLEPPMPTPVIGFGQSVALVGDIAVIGAPLEDQGGMNAGAIFVFTRNGTVWTQQTKLLGNAPFANRRLGASVALHARPGGVLEIAAGAAGPTSGEVLVFEAAGASWVQTARILPTTGGSASWFGNSVAIDGDLLAAGAWLGDGPPTNSGLATVFRRCGTDWIRQADLLGSDCAANDAFGNAISLDGDTVVVGAASHDGVLANAGASYVFELGNAPLSAYCAGDGSASACPCGNAEPAGSSAGCVNSSGRGAALVLDDALAVGADLFVARACGLVPSQPVLLFAGMNRVAGGAGASFGDGLRCAGGGVARLGVQAADAQGGAHFGPGLAALGGFVAGDTRHFQAWYRDPTGTPCGAGFNLSNGVSATLQP